MKYIELAETGTILNSGSLELENNGIRINVEYRNNTITFWIVNVFCMTLPFVPYPATIINDVSFDVAKTNIERIKSMMIEVERNTKSLKEFFEDVPEFRLYVNEDGSLSSF